MKLKLSVTIVIGLLVFGCSEDKLQKKGFQVNEISEDESGEKIVGLKLDSLKLETRPQNVLLTFHSNHRLTPIYKVNYSRKDRKPYTGSNSFYHNWNPQYDKGNKWNGNYMPGFEAMYGYNLVNISHHNNTDKTINNLFPSPVLIKTMYYPAFSKDTLNYLPVERDYYMVSVYDEDSNRDGFVNVKDLRRLYYFDIEGKNMNTIVPKNYSVKSSEYDSANDLMYVFAIRDENSNGQIDAGEPTDVFWIDLKNPNNSGEQYKTP